MTDAIPVKPAEDRSAAACKYIDEAIKGLTTLNTAVCDGAGPIGPAVDPKKAESDVKFEKLNSLVKAIMGKNTSIDLKHVKVTQGSAPDYLVTIEGGSSPIQFVGKETEDEIRANINTAFSLTLSGGGRRGKRSARRSKSFKGGRRSRKGGRKSRGCKGNKGRRSRARTIKGGAKMGKELKAWMARQQKATGVAPISKATIAATKTKSQATGSEQRSDSSKHVAAKQRNF